MNERARQYPVQHWLRRIEAGDTLRTIGRDEKISGARVHQILEQDAPGAANLARGRRRAREKKENEQTAVRAAELRGQGLRLHEILKKLALSESKFYWILREARETNPGLDLEAIRARSQKAHGPSGRHLKAIEAWKQKQDGCTWEEAGKAVGWTASHACSAVTNFARKHPENFPGFCMDQKERAIRQRRKRVRMVEKHGLQWIGEIAKGADIEKIAARANAQKSNLMLHLRKRHPEALKKAMQQRRKHVRMA